MEHMTSAQAWLATIVRSRAPDETRTESDDEDGEGTKQHGSLRLSNLGFAAKRST